MTHAPRAHKWFVEHGSGGVTGFACFCAGHDATNGGRALHRMSLEDAAIALTSRQNAVREAKTWEKRAMDAVALIRQLIALERESFARADAAFYALPKWVQYMLDEASFE